MLTGKFENGIDIMFSFDTTGSMYPCLAEVRRKIKELVRSLFNRVPNLRIGIIAHGDYCDERSSYVLKMLDLTSDEDSIIDFVQNVDPTGGGDAAECYELVLNTARSANWRAGKSRVLVLIGDDLPHAASEHQNKRRLDWANEARMLQASGISVYSVQCLNRSYATHFYRQVAQLTGGIDLQLHQFRYIENLLVGVALRQSSAEELLRYEEQVRGSGGFTGTVEIIFDRLSGRESRKAKVREDGMVPVDPSRFQVFEVDGQPAIRDFVEEMGIKFEKGRGFYPLVTRRETIQENKEVILEDLTTGELFTGAEVRERIGLPYGCRGDIAPWPLGPNFRLWVQSTSVNRTLRDPWFMYEVPDKAEDSMGPSRAKSKGGKARSSAKPPKGMRVHRVR